MSVQHILMSPYMQPSHPSAPVQMRTGSLQLLSSLLQQPLPSLSPDAPPIRIHRFLPLPVSSPASLDRAEISWTLLDHADSISVRAKSSPLNRRGSPLVFASA